MADLCLVRHPPISVGAATPPPRALDLGREGTVLFVFACNDDVNKCPTWDMNAGANSCCVLDETGLADGLMLPPVSREFPQRSLDRWLDEQVHPAWRVTRWVEKDDGIPESYPGFFGLHHGLPDGHDEEEYARYQSAVCQGTKLGSVPFWIQFPEVPPGERFLGQIDCNCCQAFGDNGLGYMFLTGPASAPRGWFLWQCT